MESASDVLDRAIAAHGGLELHRRTSSLDVVASSSGFLFTLKRRPPQPRARLRIFTREPRATFFDFPQPGHSGEWIGETEVCILDGSGAVVERRERPREAFYRRGRMRPWDHLDFLFFGAYAYWNYFNLPFLLLRDGVTLQLLPPSRGGLQRLDALFPADVPTHSPRQRFFFAPTGEIVRHDYTADVVGGWATASHLSTDFRDFGGLRAATTRRVRPRILGSPPLPAPLIVAIDVHELSLNASPPR